MGLIYIPNWPLENTPVAIMDLMLADLPHVQYISQEKLNRKKAEEAAKRTTEIQERVKKHGLGINFSNQKAVEDVLRPNP